MFRILFIISVSKFVSHPKRWVDCRAAKQTAVAGVWVALFVSGIASGSVWAQVADERALATADVPALIETVKANADIHGDIVLGLAARERLAARGKSDTAAVVPLILDQLRMLDAPKQVERQQRIALIGVLQDMGAAAEAAVPMLDELANGPRSVGDWVKFQAGAALAAIGTPAARAANQSAARATAEKWVGGADDADVRKAVAENAYLIRKELRGRQPSDAVIDASVEMLRVVGSRARAAAPTLLRTYGDARLGAALRARVRAVLEAAGETDIERTAAALATGGEPDLLGAVIEDTRSEFDLVRSLAMMELGSFGPSERSIDALITALDAGRSPGDVALALGNFRDAAARAVPALVPYLDHDTAGPNAIQAVAKIGDPTPAVVAALREIVAADGSRYRGNAASALGELGVAEAVGDLAAALSDERKYTRILSANAIAKIGPEAAAAVPALAGLLIEADADVRRSATEALGRIGPDAHDAVPLIGDQLDAADNRLKRSAEQALERIGGDRAEAILVADAKRYLAADRAEYRRIRSAGDLPAIERFLSPLPPRRRLPLAGDIAADAEPEVAFYGALIFVEAGEGPAAVPVMANIVATSDRGHEMLARLAGAALHGDQAKALPEILAGVAEKLKADFSDYTPEQQARIRATMEAVGQNID